MTPHKRNQLELQLAEQLVHANEEGTIDLTEMQRCSGYILANVPVIHTREQYLTFFRMLAYRWPFFTPMLTIAEHEQSGNTDKHKEQAIIEKLQSYIHQ